jgi:membrane protein implicated in regulation of membrane protease activity
VLLLGAILLAVFLLPSPWGIIAVFVGGTLDIVESLVLLRWSKRRKAVTGGAEALVGRTAVVATPLRPTGQVHIAGELWAARSEAGADPGDEVVVRSVDGLTLFVD